MIPMLYELSKNEQEASRQNNVKNFTYRCLVNLMFLC